MLFSNEVYVRKGPPKLGAHGRLRATPLATNCGPKAPRGGGGCRGSWRPRIRGVAPSVTKRAVQHNTAPPRIHGCTVRKLGHQIQTHSCNSREIRMNEHAPPHASTKVNMSWIRISHQIGANLVETLQSSQMPHNLHLTCRGYLWPSRRPPRGWPSLGHSEGSLAPR